MQVLSENDAEIISLGNNTYRFVPKGIILDYNGNALKEFKFSIRERHSLAAAVESVAVQIIRRKLKLTSSQAIEVIKE